MSKSSKLNWKLFVTPAVTTVSHDMPPGETARMWSPTSSILIYGERDAILVDTRLVRRPAHRRQHRQAAGALRKT
jgi:hypothetical protein